MKPCSVTEHFSLYLGDSPWIHLLQTAILCFRRAVRNVEADRCMSSCICERKISWCDINISPNFSCFRVLTKNLFNPQFGSIFRTCHNPTYFSRRLCRFSDIYMASLSCLLNYDPSYTFYPRRTPLQHEAPLWMDQLCTGCMKTPFLEEMSHIRWEPCSPEGLIGFLILGLVNTWVSQRTCSRV